MAVWYQQSEIKISRSFRIGLQASIRKGENAMWLQACLNGSRKMTDHSAVPLTPAALAEDARRVLAAGAVSLHVHSIDEAGVESLAPDVVGETLKAIREACPGVAVGISTAAYIEPNLSRRLTLMDTWSVLPDFVSVNLSEPGIEQVMAVMVQQGVGLEAGIWTAADARFLLSLTDVSWLRLLLEPWESNPEQAKRIVDTIEDVLGDALPQVPRLIHGTDEAVWPLLERAMRSGHVSRIGLEDTLLLPSGEVATDNAALVRAAKTLMNPSVA
ncbi:MAG: 3-keto-5-aminohexanoate cleavage protein [Desulfobacterales bacterium]